MNLSEYDISHPYTATVLDSQRMTPEDNEIEVRHIVLDIKHPGFIFIEGQSVGLLVPGPHEFGNRHHFRLYSIASSRDGEDGKGSQVSLCVRRCFYNDEISGERYKGVASNFLCDRKPGDKITITGPYGRHFVVPRDESCNLLMLGVGTGIAPFRAFVRHIYNERGGWTGQVRLFYGAQTGMEMLYMNDAKNDLGQFYTESTFKAFESVSSRPHFDEPIAFDKTLAENAEDVWDLLQDSKTYVYVAGLEKQMAKMDEGMALIAGSDETWAATKRELAEEGRWAELLY